MSNPFRQKRHLGKEENPRPRDHHGSPGDRGECQRQGSERDDVLELVLRTLQTILERIDDMSDAVVHHNQKLDFLLDLVGQLLVKSGTISAEDAALLAAEDAKLDATIAAIQAALAPASEAPQEAPAEEPAAA